MTGHWAGKHGTDYPVKAGQVWQVGQHLLVCSDLMGSTLFDQVLKVSKPTLVYCDPPWGQALVNSFRTQAGLTKAEYDWTDLYRRIAALGHSRNIPVWLEGSKADSKIGMTIPSTMQRATGFRAYAPIKYAAGAAAGLYYCGPDMAPIGLMDRLRGMHDRDTPAEVMRAYPLGTVVEPCCGLGGTPMNAVKVGWSSLNNEINPYRMSSALHSLSRITRSAPRQVTHEYA